MFGNIGQIMNVMKNMGQIKQNMKAMNERLQAARFVGESGGGQVRATVDGRGEIIGLKIEPALVKAGDVEMLEDLVCAAVKNAINISREAIQKEVQEATGGLDLPGMNELIGGGGA